jgi:hypothetical protein
MCDKEILLPASLKSPAVISSTSPTPHFKTYRQAAAKHYRKIFARKSHNHNPIHNASTVQY